MKTDLAVPQLDELIEAVNDLRRRVQALEQGSAPGALQPTPEVAYSEVHSSLPPDLSTGILPGLGRLLLGIAGAYLLRAITDAHILPQLAGTLAGLLYACAWLLWSIRIAPQNRVIIAIQAITASMIAAPLLWEATSRFHAIPVAGAAGALAIFVALGQLVAWRSDHSLIAGVTALAGSATAIALIIATLDPVPFAIALLAAAVVAEIGACRDRALGARWIVALAAYFCVFLLIFVSTRREGLPEGYAPISPIAVIVIATALAILYLSSIAIRTLLRRQPMGWFEMFQGAGAVALAVAACLRAAPASVISVGCVCQAMGIMAYLVAFTNLARRPAIGRNFHAYATFGFLLTNGASWLLFSGGMQVALWIAIGLGATWLGQQRNTNTLRIHGALFLAATLLLPVPVSVIAVACGYAITLWLRDDHRWSDRAGAVIIAALLCWGIVELPPVLFQGPMVSVTRTALVAIIAVTLAWFGRRANLPELIWILYPWMLFGAVKLLIEDFRQGRSEILFLSLLLYGGTLLLLPRLVRRVNPAQ